MIRRLVTSLMLRLRAWRYRRRRRGWETYTCQYRRPPEYATDEEWKAALIEKMRAALKNTKFIKPLELPPPGASFKDWSQYR